MLCLTKTSGFVCLESTSLTIGARQLDIKADHISNHKLASVIYADGMINGKRNVVRHPRVFTVPHRQKSETDIHSFHRYRVVVGSNPNLYEVIPVNQTQHDLKRGTVLHYLKFLFVSLKTFFLGNWIESVLYKISNISVRSFTVLQKQLSGILVNLIKSNPFSNKTILLCI